MKWHPSHQSRDEKSHFFGSRSYFCRFLILFSPRGYGSAKRRGLSGRQMNVWKSKNINYSYDVTISVVQHFIVTDRVPAEAQVEIKGIRMFLKLHISNDLYWYRSTQIDRYCLKD